MSQRSCSNSRFARVAFSAALVLVQALACVDLKPPTPDDNRSAPEADAASSTDASSSSADGGASTEDGSIEAGSTDGGSPAWLAAKRQRLTDPPALAGNWFVSDSYLYVLDSNPSGLRRLRPSNGATVAYTFPIDSSTVDGLSASDTHVVVLRFDEGDLYDATKPNALEFAALNRPDAVIGLRTKVAWLNDKDLYAFDPTINGAPVKTHTLTATYPAIVGRRGDGVFVRDTANLDLWLADTTTKTTATWVLPAPPATPQSVSGVDGEATQVILQHTTPQGAVLKLVTRGGPTRDLTAEIMAATSSIPSAFRQATLGFAQTGRWIIYTAIGGLLAFDLVTPRLVPCQLPMSAGVAFGQPQVLISEGLLVFQLQGGDEAKEGKPGIYAVKLTDVLPP
jgi:hypothetical protein